MRSLDDPRRKDREGSGRDRALRKILAGRLHLRESFHAIREAVYPRSCELTLPANAPATKLDGSKRIAAPPPACEIFRLT